MSVRDYCLILAAIGAVSPALAHGPTRQKVEISATIAAPPDKVWAVIGNFHDMSWDPDIASTTGDGGNTVGSFRKLTLKKGGELNDDLEDYDPKIMRYSTFLPHNDVKVLPVSNFSSHLSVSPADGGKSLVEWNAAFYRGDPNMDPPPELNEDAAKKAVTEMLTNGLNGLKAKFPGS